MSDGWRGARGRRPAAQGPRPVGRLAVGPGYPWPVIIGGAVVVTGVLAWLLSHLTGLLGLMFPVGYVAVCVLAVVMVRAEAVVVTALAPPVVAGLGLVGAATVAGDTASSTLLALGVLAPLAQLLWWMLAATLAGVVVGLARFGQVHLERPARGAKRGGAG